MLLHFSLAMQVMYRTPYIRSAHNAAPLFTCHQVMYRTPYIRFGVTPYASPSSSGNQHACALSGVNSNSICLISIALCTLVTSFRIMAHAIREYVHCLPFPYRGLLFTSLSMPFFTPCVCMPSIWPLSVSLSGSTCSRDQVSAVPHTCTSIFQQVVSTCSRDQVSAVPHTCTSILSPSVSFIVAS
jgi:hypothetical protein